MIEYGNAKLSEARSADDMPVISYAGNVAYRVGTAAQRDDAFAAVQQVNSAVHGLKGDLEAQVDHSEVPRVLVPVVVTNSPLFECRLDPTAIIVPTSVEKALLLTRLRQEDRLHSVWILNDKALELFADQARNTAENMAISL